LSTDKNCQKSLSLRPDDFRPEMFIVSIEEGRSSGIPLEVLERDCNLLLFAVISPGGERVGPHVADLRYDSFRRISEEYVQAVIDFDNPNLNTRNQQGTQVSDELFEQDFSKSEELYFDLILTEVGPNPMAVATCLSECTEMELGQILDLLLNFKGEGEGMFLSSIPASRVTNLKNRLEEVGAELFVTHNEGDSE